MITEESVMASYSLSDNEWESLPDRVRAAMAAKIEAHDALVAAGQEVAATWQGPFSVSAMPAPMARLIAALKLSRSEGTALDCACIQSGESRCIVPANMTHEDIDAPEGDLSEPGHPNNPRSSYD